MKEHAIIRSIYFLLIMPITWLSIRWLWTEVCKIGGKTLQDVRQYRREHMHDGNSRSTQMAFSSWLRRDAEDPKKFDRLFVFYRYSMVPSILCFSFSILVFTTSAFDEIFGYAGLVVAVLPFIYAFIGILYGKFKKQP